MKDRNSDAIQTAFVSMPVSKLKIASLQSCQLKKSYKKNIYKIMSSPHKPKHLYQQNLCTFVKSSNTSQ